jgi:hypothetical protein
VTPRARRPDGDGALTGVADEAAAGDLVAGARSAASTRAVQHYVDRDPRWTLYEDFRL